MSIFKFIGSKLRLISTLFVITLVLLVGLKFVLAHATGYNTISGSIVASDGSLALSSGSIGYSNSSDGNSGSGTIQSDGSYSVTIAADIYTYASVYLGGGSGVGTINLTFSPNIDATSGNAVQNYVITTHIITVHVLDANGNPLSGVYVATQGTGTTNLNSGVLPANGSQATSTATNSNGIATFIGIDGFNYSSICAYATTTVCSSSITLNGDEDITLQPALSAPTYLTITSPTNAPVLRWTGVNGADSYNIYANNILIGNTTSTTYTDNNPTIGTDTYYATAVNLAGESGPSNKVTVIVENTKPSITSPSSYVISARAMLDFTVTTTGYPTPTITWFATYGGVLPPGISFTYNNNGTLTMSGQVPTQNQGYYFITFVATNSAGSTSQQFLLTTTDYAQPVTFLNANNITEVNSVPFSFTIDTTGVPVPTISKLAGSGSLPADVTLVNNKDGTATLSGDPDDASDYGVFTFTIKATNSSGTVYQPFTITIDKGTMIKNIANQTASVGTAFSMGISTTGFPEPTFTASNLPNGLSIQNNGDGTATISGTPAVGSGGSYLVTVTAYNSFGTDVQSFTLKVDEGPSITSANTATATRGQAFSFQVTATGFPAPTYTLTGTLPKGITFNSNTGLFSGTPKATDTPGVYIFTITTTNSTGTTTQTFTLTLL